MERELSRRSFSRKTIQSLVTYSFLETLCLGDLLSARVKPVVARWVAGLNELSRDVKGERIGQVEWQRKVEELFGRVDLPSLLELIDFDRLTRGVDLPEKGARSLRFKFREIEGVPAKLVFGKQIFALRKGRSVVPHGHNNMATGFLILRGNFHGRHFDRLRDEPDHLIIKPTIDRKFGRGEFSTISDLKDNVHWFEALDEPAYIFNIHVLGLNPESKKKTGRVYIDPAGEKLKDGLIRARRVTYAEVTRRYG